ncbi:UDP-glucose flavonoid 3-O-glucosyltransferase 7-like isoform X1 [Prunus avium]|uniref:Glycosyltransferase n=1 Tax=Prunus avium TaxID=42229 RepID=A0A6P5T9Q5_PRUAV|nr:UDP-glucose flavonoid 3-O-glucosyltransferase 7-like isoform X1 [Prunus avium]
MDQKTIQPHIFFFPHMSHGHMIPTIDIAKLFASKGIKTTIISTPHNLSLFSKAIERSKLSGFEIGVLALKFPAVEVGLPEGCESDHMVETQEELQKFLKATTLLAQQLEQLLKDHQPNCLVADIFFPWATDVAAKFGIPRLVFHGTNFISLCVSHHLMKMDLSIVSDSEPLVIPNLPHEHKLAGNQIPDFMKQESELRSFGKAAAESEWRSHGVLVNSFYELEPAYADHYRNFLGIKAWHIGPTFLCNKEIEDKAKRGPKASLDEHEFLKWLSSKEPNSVIYVSFGSVVKFDDAQLLEIALGLEASGQQFIWVVKKEKSDQENKEDWLPEGFEDRVEGRGLVIRGWAPQVPILEHQATGGFVTHCGWNSTMEAVTAGVPMATWPAFADQFYNEKLVTEILGIGVRVVEGAKKWARFGGDRVKKENIEKAVTEVMVGKDAEEMRSRAKALGEMARKSVEEGGSSYKDLNALIQELGLHRIAPPQS